MSSKILKLAVLPFLLLLFSVFTVNISAFSFPQFPQDSSRQLSNRVLVKFVARVNKKEVAEKYKARLVAEIPQIDIAVFETKDLISELINNLKREKIDFVEIDAVATTLTNDSLYSGQWALPKIAWDKLDVSSSAFNPATPSAKIAVVDTGVDYTHPDLTGKVDTISDWDFVNNDDDAMDDNLHGTHVAGIAAANTNNNLGIAGISINSVRILPVKVLNQDGAGYYSWVASGIIYAADSGAEVINLSLGGNVKSATLESAVNYAWNKGAVVVAAAGNSGNTSKTYPGAYPNAMAVWASDQNDFKASFSSYGSWVDVGAPGVSILSTIPLGKDNSDGSGDGYYLANGTSMATPHVAGLAGLLFSQHSGWSAQTVRSKIESTADPVSGRLYNRGYLGRGRINVFRALTQ